MVSRPRPLGRRRARVRAPCNAVVASVASASSVRCLGALGGVLPGAGIHDLRYLTTGTSAGESARTRARAPSSSPTVRAFARRPLRSQWPGKDFCQLKSWIRNLAGSNGWRTPRSRVGGSRAVTRLGYVSKRDTSLTHATDDYYAKPI